MTKGPSFELEVVDAVRRNLEQFGLRPDACQVHHRKGYFSSDRHRKIIFDISIEVHVSGSTQPSLIWVWECKDYSNPIPVSDVEEFHAKIQQLGEDNTKGTLISRGILQKSALAYAISKGIGVARFLPGDKIHWSAFFDAGRQLILEEKQLLTEHTNAALSDPSFEATRIGQPPAPADGAVYFINSADHCSNLLEAFLDSELRDFWAQRKFNFRTKNARLHLEELGFQFTLEAFFSRVKNGDTTLTKVFLASGIAVETRDSNGCTALTWAATFGDAEMVRTLIQGGAAVDGQDESGRTPLMHAARHGLILAFARNSNVAGYVDSAKTLIGRGANPKSKDRTGTTPLMFAVMSCHAPTIEIILAAGGDVSARDNKGRTALWHAADRAEIQPVKEHADQVMGLLIEAGADPLDVELAQLTLHLTYLLWPMCAGGADHVQDDFSEWEVASISEMVAILDRLMSSSVYAPKEFSELRKALQLRDRSSWLASGIGTLSVIAPHAADHLLSWIEFRKKEW